MNVFSVIMADLVPLYLLIGAGYIAGRYLDVNLHSISRICLYILLPPVFLGAMTRIDIQPSLMVLPFITMVSSYMITLSALNIAKRIWHDGTANSIASAAVNANAVYFGLPIVLALFGPQGASIYLFMNLGGAINNASLSYYISARGRFTVQQSLKRLMKLPVLYAVVLGLAFNYAGITMNPIAEKYWNYAAGALTILGMMMIGISVSRLGGLSIRWGELGALFLVKYVAWPVMLGVAIFADIHWFGLLNNEIYALMIILSFMPLFANYVAYAAENNLFPERAGSAVLLSSLFSTVAIPFAYFLIQYFGFH